MIGYGLAAGCPQSARLYQPIVQRLNDALAQLYSGPICEAIRDIILELHVSGGISDYAFIGAEKPTIKSQVARVQIGIARNEWAHSEESDRIYILALRSIDGVNAIADLAARKKITIPVEFVSMITGFMDSIRNDSMPNDNGPI